MHQCLESIDSSVHGLSFLPTQYPVPSTPYSVLDPMKSGVIRGNTPCVEFNYCRIPSTDLVFFFFFLAPSNLRSPTEPNPWCWYRSKFNPFELPRHSKPIYTVIMTTYCTEYFEMVIKLGRIPVIKTYRNLQLTK